MSKWECIVCGLIYDEAKGWPDDGIPPGTRWEDVPEDWLCPDCGVGKEDFERLEESTVEETPHHQEAEADREHAPIVIVGTGLAGYCLAREIRRYDSETPVILITADDGRSYSKPMLSTGYTKNTGPDDLAQQDAGGMGTQLEAKVWTHTRVNEIDTEKQVLHVGEDATVIHYGRLVLAVGSQVIEPPLAGDGLDYVYSVNDLMDYADFRAAMEENNARRVCIIGGGLIGCEFTNDLLNGGYEVEVVDPLGYCLPTLLPEPAGKAVQAALAAQGAVFHFGALATAVNKRDDGVTVTLDNGDTVAADLVVSAVGVRPRTALAQAAGLATNRGVVANRFLETSAPKVYALGDCAEVEGHVLVYVAPLMASARALGKTLTGERTAVSYPAMPVTIKTPTCPVVVAPPPAGTDGDWQIDADGVDVRCEFRTSSGELAGFALTGQAIREKIALQKALPPILP
jgi:rubredoxin---NAD+ reductase